jgi:chromatin modification-related protein VID21
VVEAVHSPAPDNTIIAVDGDDSADGEQIIIVDGDTTDEEYLVEITQTPMEGSEQVPITIEDEETHDLPEAPPSEAPVHVQEVAAEEPVSVASPVVDGEANDMAVDEDLFSVHGELTPPPATEPEPVVADDTEAVADDALPDVQQPEVEDIVMNEGISIQTEEQPQLNDEEPTQPTQRPETPPSDESMVIDDDDDDDAAHQPDEPVKEDVRLPSPKYYTKESTPLPAVVTVPSRPVIIREPISTLAPPSFNFSADPEPTPLTTVGTPVSETHSRHGYHPTYTLPSLKSLPADFSRKTKPKQQRKHKEREKNGGDKTKDKDDWAPMGVSRWGATLRANPVWKKVSRAPKCLSTREWSVRNNDNNRIVVERY